MDKVYLLYTTFKDFWGESKSITSSYGFTDDLEVAKRFVQEKTVDQRKAWYEEVNRYVPEEDKERKN